HSEKQFIRTDHPSGSSCQSSRRADSLLIPWKKRRAAEDITGRSATGPDCAETAGSPGVRTFPIHRCECRSSIDWIHRCELLHSRNQRRGFHRQGLSHVEWNRARCGGAVWNGARPITAQKKEKCCARHRNGCRTSWKYHCGLPKML